MNRVFEMLSVVLPVLAALGLGWYSRKKSIVCATTIEGLKTLVMRFMLPAVLLGAFYKTTFSTTLVIMTLCLFGCCLLSMGLGTLFTRIYSGGGRMLPFLTSGFEAGMMGYGLYAMLFPASYTHHFATVDLGQVLFVFTLYSALLNRQKGISTGQTLKLMVTSPVFIAIAIGVVLSVTGLGRLLHQGPAGAPIDAVLSYIGAPTGVLMIFVVGYQLVLSRASMKAALLTVGIRTIIMSALCAFTIFVLRQFIQLPDPMFWALILMFSLPAPFVLPIFSGDEAQKGYVATTLSIGTVLSIAFFALISYLA